MQDATPLPPLRIPLRRTPGEAARRPAGAALGISAGIHVLALLLGLAAARQAREADGAGEAPGRSRVSAEHVAYVDLGAWPDAAAAPTVRPAAAVPPPPAPDASAGERAAASSRTRAAADSGGTVGGVRTEGIGGEASAGHDVEAAPGAAAGPPAAPVGMGRRWRTGELDPRLVVSRQPLTARAPLGDEPYLAQFHAALQAFNDSIQGQADRDRRAASWTWTDPAGRVWGFRQGVLMIAGQGTLNVEMSGERGQELLARQQARARREGKAQAERIDRDRYLQQRGRAIRDRRDGERRTGAP